MPTIEVSDQQTADVALLAQAWKTTPDVVIRRLLDRFKYSRAMAPVRHRDSVPVHAIYKGVRVEGQYDLRSAKLTITAGPSAGRQFRTPSSAATAVITAVNPSVNPNRTGWRFWIITQSGDRLQSLRHLHR